MVQLNSELNSKVRLWCVYFVPRTETSHPQTPLIETLSFLHCYRRSAAHSYFITFSLLAPHPPSAISIYPLHTPILPLWTTKQSPVTANSITANIIHPQSIKWDSPFTLCPLASFDERYWFHPGQNKAAGLAVGKQTLLKCEMTNTKGSRFLQFKCQEIVEQLQISAREIKKRVGMQGYTHMENLLARWLEMEVLLHKCTFLKCVLTTHNMR